ncbi:MAG: cytochrome c [Steroidobacteraceae bacterium]
MDDQFLHQLRREPPANFAIRLKSQLDRPVPVRRFRSRLILGLAIFGTAFALVSPPARRALGDWFATTSHPQLAPAENPFPRAPSAAAPAGTSRGRISPRPAGLPHYASTEPSIPAPPAAVPAAAPVQNISDEVQLPARALAPVIIAGSPQQTPEMQAAQAVSLRQGLFLNLGFVTGPLISMLQRGTPLDFKVARIGATRLATLSALIPEVFLKDTRPFVSHTRALDVIWTDYPDFESKADELTLAAEVLGSAAKSEDDDATRKAIANVAAACTACHDVFRMK